MKEILLQYARYNLWANKKMIDLTLGMVTEHLDREVVSSFSSIKRTVYHCLGAENIWLQRLSLAESPVWIGDDLKMPYPHACRLWQESSEELVNFIEKQFDDSAFTHIMQFYDRQKRPHKLAVWQVIQHMCNHNTYHRGQLITMLRQLGETKLPSMDFSAYCEK